MPADSDPGTRLPALPRTWRPLGPRVVGFAVTFALVAVVVVGWFTFDDETRARFTWFQRGTLVFFGLIYLTLMLALTRSRAVAYADRLLPEQARPAGWPIRGDGALAVDAVAGVASELGP